MSLPGESGFLLHLLSIMIQSRRESLLDAPESLASLTYLLISLLVDFDFVLNSASPQPRLGAFSRHAVAG